MRQIIMKVGSAIINKAFVIIDLRECLLPTVKSVIHMVFTKRYGTVVRKRQIEKG